MTPGLREHRGASLRIAIAECMPEDMRVQMREIVGVKSTNPRKGHATALLHQVCAEADKWWITLFIKVERFDDGAGGMDDEQLRKWYGRFDFIVVQDEPCLMARSPQRPKIMRVH